MSDYKTEFPDFESEIPSVFLASPWTDQSWHNDATPSFARSFDNGREIHVFVDELDPAKRWRADPTARAFPSAPQTTMARSTLTVPALPPTASSRSSTVLALSLARSAGESPRCLRGFPAGCARRFCARGHDAVSCDLLPAEDCGTHRQEDALRVAEEDDWDLMVARSSSPHSSGGQRGALVQGAARGAGTGPVVHQELGKYGAYSQSNVRPFQVAASRHLSDKSADPPRTSTTFLACALGQTQPCAYKGTQIASSGRWASPNARRRSGGRLATQAAMNASRRSCRLPDTANFSLDSSFSGSQPVRAATALS
jgi:hypothetical protein